MVSKPLPTSYGSISSLESTSKIVVTGTELGYLTFYKRGAGFKTFKLDGEVNTIMSFDTLFVVHSSIEGGSDFSEISTYEVSDVSASSPTAKLLNSFQVPKSDGVIHPTSYVNKILTYGSNTCLFNIRSQKCIYDFKLRTKKIFNTPALDTVAMVGAVKASNPADSKSGGKTTLYNLKLNKALFTLDCDAPIKSITFRTDGLCSKVSPMICATTAGLMTWDLRTKSIVDKNDDVRQPNSVVALKNEPLVVVTVNNGVKVMAYDVDLKGRLLRERLGHKKPISKVMYLNGNFKTEASGATVDDCNILTASREIRVFNTGRSALDCEWSQGKGLIKRAKEIGMNKEDLLLPDVLDFGYDPSKKVGVSIHKDTAFTYVWSKEERAQNGPVLRQDDWKVGNMQVKPDAVYNATSVGMSACGEFAVVGTRGGGIFKYNVESGEGRGSFPKNYTETVKERRDRLQSKLIGSVKRTMKEVLGDNDVTTSDANKRERMNKLAATDKEERMVRSLERRHDEGVVGCWVDKENLKMYSIDEEGKVLGWNFRTRLAERREPRSVGAEIVKASFNYDSDMIIYGVAQGGLGVWDCRGGKVVRRMRGGGEVNDICWGGDGRRVFCSVSLW